MRARSVAVAPFAPLGARRERALHRHAFAQRAARAPLRSSAAGSAERCRDALAVVTGPRPSRRLRTISTQRVLARPRARANSAGASIGGAPRAVADTDASNCGRRSAATQIADSGSVRIASCMQRRAPVRARARRAMRASRSCRCDFRAAVTKPSPSSASCISSALAASGHASLAHALDRRDVEPSEVGRRSRRRASDAPSPPACGAPRAARRRDTRTAARSGSSSASGDGSGRSRATIVDRRRTSMPRSSALEPFDVHRLVQAVVDGLPHERMIGDLAVADEVVGARDLVGKHRRHQVLGAHALQRRRHLLAAAKARQRERRRRDPAPARREHRRIQHRLDQHVANACSSAGSARRPRAGSCGWSTATGRSRPRSPRPAARNRT